MKTLRKPEKIELNLIKEHLNKKSEMDKKILNAFIEDEKFGYDWSMYDYAKVLKTCATPQRYGIKIQNRIIKKLSAVANGKEKESGDMTWRGKSYEIKCSIVSDQRDRFNVDQIRPYQNVKHLCVFVDIENNKEYIFVLTHKQMIYENDRIGHCAHGIDNSDYEKREYKITLRRNTPDFKRWISKYSRDDITL